MELKAISFFDVSGGFAYFERINSITGEVDSCVLKRTANSGTDWGITEFDGRIIDISSIPGKINSYVIIKVDTDDNDVIKTYITNNNGSNWTLIDENVYYTKVIMTDADHGWVGGRVSSVSGGIYKWPEAPYFVSSPQRNYIEGESLHYEIEVYDVNNKEITITFNRPPTWITLYQDYGDGTGLVEGETPIIPSSDTVARYLLTIVASNGVTSREQRDTLYIRTSKTPPVFLSHPVEEASVYRLYEYNIEVDTTGGKIITMRTTSIPSWLGLFAVENGKATLSGVPSSSGGSNRVVLEATDGLYTITQNFSIQVAPLSDVEDFGFGKIEIYPNPSSDVLNIVNSQGAEYEVLDITGRILQTGKIMNSVEKIDITKFSDGNLFLKMYNEDKVYTTKFVKM
jgi:hypothetical protein